MCIHKGKGEVLMFHCLICNQAFDFERVFEVDFFWTDDLYHGKPVCKGCVKTLEGHPHLNYDMRKDPQAMLEHNLRHFKPGNGRHKKSNLDRWISPGKK